MQARSRRALAAVTTTALAAALVGAAPSSADPATIDTVELTNDATWQMEYYETGNIFDTPTVSIDEGDLSPQTDGLDGGFELKIGTKTFAAEESGDLTGAQLVVGPSIVSGLKATVAYRALPGSATMRMLVTLKNPTKKNVTKPVQVATDLGSDSSTTVAATSSGNKQFAEADRWLITADDLESPSDPVVTQVYGGAGGLKRTDTAQFQEFVAATSRVTVPGRSVRHLLLFVQLSPTVTKAKKSAKAFNDKNLSAALLNGISRNVRKKILNWDL